MINYFIAQKYVEAFGKLAESPQQKTVIVPADMASLVGSIAGITQLVKTAQAEQPPAPPRSGDAPPGRRRAADLRYRPPGARLCPT